MSQKAPKGGKGSSKGKNAAGGAKTAGGAGKKEDDREETLQAVVSYLLFLALEGECDPRKKEAHVEITRKKRRV